MNSVYLIILLVVCIVGFLGLMLTDGQGDDQ